MVAARRRLSDADHRRVTEAVRRAEAKSDGEIVTIVADTSDGYWDVVLIVAAVAMLLVPATFAFLSPVAIEALFGWVLAPVYRELVLTVFFAQFALLALILSALAFLPVRMAAVPEGTKIRRVRARAIQYFRASAEKRTIGLTGVLIYLSLAEHRAEIVADASIHEKVEPEVWAGAMAALLEKVRDGDAAGGMVEAVARVGAVLAGHFPKSDRNPNELPDRLIEV